MKMDNIIKFVKEHNLAVVATVTPEGKSQSAVVEFAETDNLTIVIDTFTSSRKYKNIIHNPSVSLVIGWEKDITVQIDGEAKELKGKELEQAKRSYFIKNPYARKWENNSDIVYLAIKPTWIRYSDLNRDPWLIQEFILD